MKANKRTITLAIITALVVFYSVYEFVEIKKSYNENTLFALASNTNGYGSLDEDIKYINSNYEYHQLRTDNIKMQQNFALARVWTFDLIAFAFAFLLFKHFELKKE